MKKLWTKKFIKASFFGFILMGIASCTVSPTSPTAGGSNVAMRTQLDNIIIHSSGNASPQSFGTIDSLQVTSAGFAASNFMLRSDLADEPNHAEGAIRPPQFLLGFDLSGRQYIGEAIIDAYTYRRARFDMHPLYGNQDSLALALGPLYSSLFRASEDVPANLTIVIQGYVWQSGVKMPFTYRSAFTGSGNVYFDQPLVVSTDSPIEVLVRFSTMITFTDAMGAIMDPRDGRNGAAIETNLKGALKGSVNTPAGS